MSISGATNSTNPTSIAPPILTSQDKVLSDIIAKHFTVVFQNVAEFEEAEVILLAESHNEPFHREWNAKLIDASIRPHDIVLVEYIPGMASFSGQVSKVKSNLTIDGWDHPCRLEDDRRRYKTFCRFLEAIEALLFKPDSHTNWLTEIGKLIKCYPQYRSWDKPFFQQEIKRDFGRYTKEEQPKIAEALICNIAIEWGDYFEAGVGATLASRNDHMVDQIAAHSFAGRRIYVIAGGRHLIDENNGLNPNWDAEASRAITALREGLNGKKYIILDPIRNPNDGSYALYKFKEKWNSYSTDERIKTVGSAAAALPFVPIIGARMGYRALKRELTPFHPSDLKSGCYTREYVCYLNLVERFIYKDLDALYFAEGICKKYNQPLRESERNIRNEIRVKIEIVNYAKKNCIASVSILGRHIILNSPFK